MIGFGILSGDWKKAEEKTRIINLIEPVVEGSFTDILVDPVNFDIEEVISINIAGGNGEGATASATLVGVKPIFNK